MQEEKKKCLPCEDKNLKVLSESEIKEEISVLNGWEIVEGKKLQKIFKFKNFVEGADFVNKIVDVAEMEGHHPDVLLSYGKVTVELFTHSLGGLTQNDFVVAQAIDEIS